MLSRYWFGDGATVSSSIFKKKSSPIKYEDLIWICYADSAIICHGSHVKA